MSCGKKFMISSGRILTFLSSPHSWFTQSLKPPILWNTLKIIILLMPLPFEKWFLSPLPVCLFVKSRIFVLKISISDINKVSLLRISCEWILWKCVRCNHALGQESPLWRGRCLQCRCWVANGEPRPSSSKDLQLGEKAFQRSKGNCDTLTIMHILLWCHLFHLMLSLKR